MRSPVLGDDKMSPWGDSQGIGTPLRRGTAMRKMRITTVAFIVILATLLGGFPSFASQVAAQSNTIVCGAETDFPGLVVSNGDDCFQKVGSDSNSTGANDGNATNDGSSNGSTNGDANSTSANGGNNSDVYTDDSTLFSGVDEAQAFCITRTIAGHTYKASSCTNRWEILTEGGLPQVAHLKDGQAVTIRIPAGYWAQVWACKTKRDLPLYVVGPSRIHVACQAAVRKYDIYNGEQPDANSFVYVPAYTGTVSTTDTGVTNNGSTGANTSGNGANNTGNGVQCPSGFTCTPNTGDANNGANSTGGNATSGSGNGTPAASAKDCTINAVVKKAGGDASTWNAVTNGGFQGVLPGDFTVPSGWAVNDSANALHRDGTVAGGQLVTIYPCAS